MTEAAKTQVGAMTLKKLRNDYHDTWGRDWPHDDDYLRTLWAEARADTPKGHHRVPPPEVWSRCADAMRENHDFTTETH